MSGIRELIVVSAAVLAFSAVADAHELRPIAARGIDQAVTAAPAVEVRHGPRFRVLSLGGKTTADIAIWRTVTLGTYKTIDALRDALDTERIHVGDRANEMLGRPAFNLSKMRRDAHLVVLAVSELGFEDESASLGHIYARARQLGFELCPAEVGPQLRLRYLDQPLGRVPSYRHGAYCGIWRGADRLHRSQWRRRAHSHRWLRGFELHRALDNALCIYRLGGAATSRNRSSRPRFDGQRS